MTDWTTPRTWTVGERTTKAILDTHIRDNENHLKEQLTTMQSIPPLTIESAIFPLTTGVAASVQQIGSSAAFPSPNWLEAIFPSTADAHLQWKRVLPGTLGSVAVVRVHGYMVTGTSGNIGFGVQIAAVSDGDATLNSKAFDATNLANETVPATVWTKFVLDITLTNKDGWAADDEILIDLYRNTAVGSNAAGNCMVTLAQLLFTS
jgi:hypothetical protein